MFGVGVVVVQVCRFGVVVHSGGSVRTSHMAYESGSM
jgi:hypothetical protein